MSLLSLISVAIRRNTRSGILFSCKSCLNYYKTPVSRASSSITKIPIHDVNTNVVKDVILFKYENQKYFKYMNLLAVIQYMFCSYLGFFALRSLKDAPVDESTITKDTPWFRRINLRENKYRNTLGALAVVIGTGSLAMIWMYTLKSVRYLILNKGGKHVTFVTYTPFGKNRMMKVPLENVCCKDQRTSAKVQLPLKVKNTWMHYMLDMRGEFKNSKMKWYKFPSASKAVYFLSWSRIGT